MHLLDERSLGRTVDRINDSSFSTARIPAAERARAAAWIASRQGGPRCYCGLFAPTDADWAAPLALFTGEKVTTGAGRSHVLGQESYRALLVLKGRGRAVTDAINGACEGMVPRLVQASSRWGAALGDYCCGTCSVSVWRAMAAGAYPQIDAEAWLAAGLKSLRSHRKPSGDWRRYPLWYTLLALSEMDGDAAREERRYAAPALEKFLKRKAKSDAINARHRAVAERVLGLS